jgi:hypothetical protein
VVNVGGFDPNDVDPIDNFGSIPEGEYEAEIIESHQRDTRAGDGSFIELTFRITSGPFENRQLIDRLNLNNPSVRAVQMARASLAAICRAVGIDSLNDSTELHHLPMQIEVRQRPRTDTGEMTSEVINYRTLHRDDERDSE